MPIKTDSVTNFPNVQIIDLRHMRALAQTPQPTFRVKYTPINFDDEGRKSWPDTPIKEIFIKNIDTLAYERALTGKPAMAQAFAAMEIAIAEYVSEREGVDYYYEQ